MTGSSTQGIKIVLHPVTDLARAKPVYAALLGVEPMADSPYYVGFEAEGVLARGGYRGETGRGDRRRRRRQGVPARRRRRPLGGLLHRSRWQRPRGNAGPELSQNAMSADPAPAVIAVMAPSIELDARPHERGRRSTENR
jgi:hypothetical protein